jgi:hypothetical protein
VKQLEHAGRPQIGAAIRRGLAEAKAERVPKGWRPRPWASGLMLSPEDCLRRSGTKQGEKREGER